MRLITALRVLAGALVFLTPVLHAAPLVLQPKLEAHMLDGGEFGFLADAERALLVVIWAPDSLGSRKSFGELQRFDSVYAARGVRTVAVAASGDAAGVRSFLSGRGLRMPAALLGAHELGRLQVDELPLVMAYDRQGHRVGQHRGMYRLRDLERLVEPLLEGK